MQENQDLDYNIRRRIEEIQGSDKRRLLRIFLDHDETYNIIITFEAFSQLAHYSVRPVMLVSSVREDTNETVHLDRHNLELAVMKAVDHLVEADKDLEAEDLDNKPMW